MLMMTKPRWAPPKITSSDSRPDSGAGLTFSNWECISKYIVKCVHCLNSINILGINLRISISKIENYAHHKLQQGSVLAFVWGLNRKEHLLRFRILTARHQVFPILGVLSRINSHYDCGSFFQWIADILIEVYDSKGPKCLQPEVASGPCLVS